MDPLEVVPFRRGRFIGPNTHQPKPRMSPGWPERGRKDSPVILSAAKDLSAHRARPFAALRVTLSDNLG